MGPGTYGSQRGRPPKQRSPQAPVIKTSGMTPEMKKKLKEALEKRAKKAVKKVQKKMMPKQGTRNPTKKRKQKYNPYGPGTMNPTRASYGTGP